MQSGKSDSFSFVGYYTYSVMGYVLIFLCPYFGMPSAWRSLAEKQRLNCASAVLTRQEHIKNTVNAV